MTNGASHPRLLKYYTLFGFFVIGVITVLIGQVLPILSSRLALNDAESGTLLLAQFAGSITGTLVAAPVARRFGFVVATIAGIVMMIAGLPGLNLHSYLLCWLAVFTYGIGLGITIPAVNLMTIEITETAKQASHVNLVNFMWGLGAISSRPFVAAISANESLVGVTLILELALVLLLALFIAESRRVTAPRVEHPVISDPVPRIWNRPLAFLFLLFGFFVIGIESGIAGWLTTYSQKLERTIIDASPTDLFFIFLVAGRGVAWIAGRHLSENALISICSILLMAGISLIVFGGELVVIGAALAGLGASAIFPTNMVRFTKAFGPTATKNATPLFIAGILGAALLSWLTGIISTAYQSLTTGLSVFVFAAVMVFVLQIAIVVAIGKSAKAR